MSKNEFIEMRETLASGVEIIDTVLELIERDEKGEDVTEEIEQAVGKFMIKMIELTN